MKILMLVRLNPHILYRGVERFVMNLSIELLKLGCDVQIMHGYNTGRPSLNERNASNLSTYGITHVPIWLLGSVQFNVKLARAASELMRLRRFDVVDAHAAGVAYPFSTIIKKNGGVFVYHAHDCIQTEYNAVKAFSSLSMRKILYYKLLIHAEKLACRQATLVFANSKSTEKGLIASYDVPPDKLITEYLGIEDDYAKSYETVDPKSPIFLHVATNHERRGTRYLLSAMKILQDRYDIKAKTIIVGEKSPQYISMAKLLNVNASFVGRISDTKLKNLYAKCSCLVVPSLRESFCLPVIEAASFAKASIVSNVGSLPELVENKKTGLVVNVGDELSLARSMYLMIVDDNLRRRMGLNAIKKANFFKISNVAKRTLKIYQEMLNSYL